MVKAQDRYRQDDQEVERRVGDDDPPPRSKVKMALIIFCVAGFVTGGSVAAAVLAPHRVPDKLVERVNDLLARLGFDIEVDAAMETSVYKNLAIFWQDYFLGNGKIFLEAGKIF